MTDWSQAVCIVEECPSPHSAAGLCNTHYQRRRKGIPLQVNELPHATYAAARFWSKVEVGHPSICWRWRGSTTHYGYGQATDLTARKGQTLAHRVSYELAFGPPPRRDSEGRRLVIDHLCENPICVNPAHLEVVSQQENTQRGWDSQRATHCKQGHELVADNRVVERSGRVRCRECKNIRQRRYDGRGKERG